MTNKDDKKPGDSVYRIQLPKGLAKQAAETAQQITKLYNTLYTDEIRSIAESATRIQQELVRSLAHIDTQGIVESVRKITESIARSTRGIEAHLPDNWPDGLGDAADLCIKGIPVVFVPRSEIIQQILEAKNSASIKRVLVRNAPAVLEDCEKVLAECTWLTNDMREHIKESIACYRDGKYRAAQSTATIAFDVLLNDVVDIKAWRNKKKNKRTLSATVVSKYTSIDPGIDLMELPLGGVPFYTLLMLPILGRMLSMFDLADKSTHGNDANRHMATHMVSSKQYKKSNALLTIMTVASICKVTQLNGKNWVQSSTEHYGLNLVES